MSSGSLFWCHVLKGIPGRRSGPASHRGRARGTSCRRRRGGSRRAGRHGDAPRRGAAIRPITNPSEIMPFSIHCVFSSKPHKNLRATTHRHLPRPFTAPFPSSTYGLGLCLGLGVVRAASRCGGGLDLVGRVVDRRRPRLPTRRGQLSRQHKRTGVSGCRKRGRGGTWKRGGGWVGMVGAEGSVGQMP